MVYGDRTGIVQFVITRGVILVRVLRFKEWLSRISVMKLSDCVQAFCGRCSIPEFDVQCKGYMGNGFPSQVKLVRFKIRRANNQDASKGLCRGGTDLFGGHKVMPFVYVDCMMH